MNERHYQQVQDLIHSLSQFRPALPALPAEDRDQLQQLVTELESRLQALTRSAGTNRPTLAQATDSQLLAVLFQPGVRSVPPDPALLTVQAQELQRQGSQLQVQELRDSLYRTVLKMLELQWLVVQQDGRAHLQIPPDLWAALAQALPFEDPPDWLLNQLADRYELPDRSVQEALAWASCLGLVRYQPSTRLWQVLESDPEEST